MANIPKSLSKKLMSTTIDDIFKRKAARRRELAALPFEKKIEIVEQLRDLGKATAPFRARSKPQKTTPRQANE